MEPQKKRLFIYDRKEVGVLILLGVGISLFAFTLGVHLGKQVLPHGTESAAATKAVTPVEAERPMNPNRTEVAEQVRNANDASKEALSESLRDEVAKTGLQVDHPRALEYPSGTRNEKKAALKAGDHPATGKPGVEHSAPPKTAAATTSPAPPAEIPALESDTPGATSTARAQLKELARKSEDSTGDGGAAESGLRYTLQVGSYPSFADARPRLSKLNESGLPAEIKEVDLKGKGKWFRVVIGHFATVAEAEKTGKSYQQENRIKEFVVVNLPK